MAIRSNLAEKKYEIGIFWDIENCQVPYGKSASELVQTIRRYLELEHPECRYAYDFVAACDVFKLRETHRITDQLNKIGVDVLHVNGMLKNAADDKLKECIEKFADRHGEGARLVLISGDADFAPAIRAARRKGLYTINFYKANGSAEELRINCHEAIPFEIFLSDNLHRTPLVVNSDLPSLNQSNRESPETEFEAEKRRVLHEFGVSTDMVVSSSSRLASSPGQFISPKPDLLNGSGTAEEPIEID